jgi:hypothetical protein
MYPALSSGVFTPSPEKERLSLNTQGQKIQPRITVGILGLD